jgi:hypothetical protein
MPGVFDPTKAFTTASHPFSLTINGVDIIPRPGVGTLGRKYGATLESMSVSEVGANGASSMSFLYEDPASLYTLPAGARVLFTNNVANEVLFSGYIIRRAVVPIQSQQGYAVSVTCTDYSMLLDLAFVPALKYAAGHTDQKLIQAVVANTIRHTTIYTHTSLCTQTNASMEAVDFSDLTLRSAIEQVQMQAGPDRHYYVDFLGRLHYYSGATESGMGAAPFVISDVPTGSQRAPSDLELEYDDSQIVNCVYIIGATPLGTGWVKDETSIKAYGLRQGSLEVHTSKTVVSMVNAGSHFLTLHKDPLVRGSFSQQGTDTGWRVGQAVTVTNAALGISSAVYPVRQIDTTFEGGNGLRTRVINFGELPARGGHRSPAVHNTPYATAAPPAHVAPKPAAKIVGHAGKAKDKQIH